MSDFAIRVDGISKLYCVAPNRTPHSSLREMISDGVAQTFHGLHNQLLRKRRPTEANNSFWALKEVTFSVAKGETVGLVGANGSGKSTLLKVLSRIVTPTVGEAEICGRVGALLEVGTGFHPELTGRDNIYLNGSILGMSRYDIRRRFDAIVDFAGVERFIGLLKAEGFTVGRLHVATLMKRMGIEALYRKPNTSKPAPSHRIYPYLLRELPITRPNQVWAMDITYIPMARGFVYLAAVVDWFSRRVLAWRLSITLEAAFCIEALEEALARYGRPEVFNTDQGSQFTSHDFTSVLLKNEIAISMDGRGAWRDNVFVERLWRSIKDEEVYLKAYDTVVEARTSIGRYLTFYNGRRPHSSLDRRTPDQAYFTPLPQLAAA